MKFRLPSWDASPQEWAEFHQAYARHLEQMRAVLPEQVLELATLPGVEDGLIVEYFYDENACTLRLVLLCGNLQKGYYDLVINYSDVEISPEHKKNAYISGSEYGRIYSAPSL